MTEDSRAEQFLKNYSGCEARLFAYVLALLGNWSDAEEVYQETTLALWRSFGDFEDGTNFMNWAKRIAFHRVLTFRKVKKRQGIPHSEEFLRTIAEAASGEWELHEARMNALADCLAKLPPKDQQLILLRYEKASTIKAVAQRLGRPANTLYKALERIRHALLECVDLTIARKER